MKLEFVAASLDQMRRLEALTLESLPARVPVAIPGCASGPHGRCPWAQFRTVVQKAIDPKLTDLR